jgi:hypothetical protein
MGYKRNLALPSIMAIVIGVVLIIAPILLLPGQVEYPESRMEQLSEKAAPTPTAPSEYLKGEAVDQSTQPLFMFEFDVDSSSGFSRTFLSHETFGTPVFTVAKGESATIVILISSLSESPLHVSLDRIDGLRFGVTAELEPEIFTLDPYEQKKIELTISVSTSASSSFEGPSEQRGEDFTNKAIHGEFIQLVLKGNDYDLGTGFLLVIT